MEFSQLWVSWELATGFSHSSQLNFCAWSSRCNPAKVLQNAGVYEKTSYFLLYTRMNHEFDVAPQLSREGLGRVFKAENLPLNTTLCFGLLHCLSDPMPLSLPLDIIVRCASWKALWLPRLAFPRDILPGTLLLLAPFALNFIESSGEVPIHKRLICLKFSFLPDPARPHSLASEKAFRVTCWPLVLLFLGRL